ncbi:MAG: S-layer homology domain-containing protein, partial [Clostridiales bacterium]
MKFRFALLVAALALALSISAFAYSEEPAQDTAAPAQEETTTEDSAPFVLLRVYEGQFADVKDGDWFAPPVVSADEYGGLNGRSESSFAPNGNVTIAELLTIAARLRAIYTTGSDAVIPAAKENEAWYAPYVSYLKSQNLLDNSFEGFYLLPASRAQMAGIFAFAVPEEWYTEPNASLVTSAYASREYITDVTDKTPYRSEILL